MQVLDDVGLLLVPNLRGLMYLDRFVKNNILPGLIIVQGPDLFSNLLKRYPRDFFIEYADYFSPHKTLQFYQEKYDLNVIQLIHQDINSLEMKAAIENAKERYFFYTGGGIIRNDLFETGRRFIHSHSGRLPDYKGSTCFYYSMLKEKKCAATTFFMSNKIDAGDVILSKNFDVPSVHYQYSYFFDTIYDSWIRAEVVDLTLQNYLNKGCFDAEPQSTDCGEFYYVIHPFLKNAALSIFTSDHVVKQDKLILNY